MRTWPALRLSGLSASTGGETPLAELVHAALTDYPVAAIEEPSADQWQIFFAVSDERHAAASALGSLFPMLSITPEDIDDGNWAARSQASLRAIRAGDVIVAPPWDVQPELATRQIVIRPSMGFGTGHHATTRLCLTALQRLPLPGRRVIDIGTGSGILAIAASLFGASEVVGIDDDADAIEAARDNLTLNDRADVQFVVAELRSFSGDRFDVLTANLTGGLLAATADRLECLVQSGGTMILSGLLATEFDAVVTRFTGCDLAYRSDEDEWVCVVLTRKGAV